jgi:glycosyltransferase involved in cell wall biosynthesis
VQPMPDIVKFALGFPLASECFTGIGAVRMDSKCSPRVTVITPAYNVEKYIGDAIRSVLNQSYRDFEYLIIDDDSSDATVREITDCIRSDHRARLITQGHAGPSHARNLGIAAARGEFVAFLDGDDRWHRDFLREQLALIERLGPDVAAVFARARVMSETGRIYLFRWQRSGRYDFDDMLVRSCPPRTGSSLLIKKSAFTPGLLFNSLAEPCEDLDMWLHIQRESGMPYFWGSSKYLLDIRLRPGGISRNPAARFQVRDALIEKHSQALQRHPRELAYLRPSVFAYRAGHDERADRWAGIARRLGWRILFLDSYGWRMLGWSMLGAGYRRGLRASSQAARSLVGRLVGAPGGLLR